MNAMIDYVPMDRRHALASGHALPDRAVGAALFTDISGFTPATEALARMLGPQRGAEELLALLNGIYQALMAEVDRFGGSVISFAGDALSVWFDTTIAGGLAQASLCALACAFSMQAAIAPFGTVTIAGGAQLALAIKISVATGPVRRLLVGEPTTQLIEVLCGTTIVRLAAVASLTRTNEVAVDQDTADLLRAYARLGERRATDTYSCVVVTALAVPVEPRPWPPSPSEALSKEQLRSWLLPSVYHRLHSGQGEFLAELRHTISLFMRFADLDYETDAAGAQLDAFIRWVQQVLARSKGWLIQLSMGDKGSYLYACFGAPIAYGDEAVRAVAAALELRAPPPTLAHMGSVHIGISGGQSRAGAVGGSTRTYSVIGDATNLAARLMEHASAGQVLMSANLVTSVSRRYTLKPLQPLHVKGKAGQIALVEVCGARPATTIELEEPQYASPLIGRVAELGLIDEQIGLAARGQGQVLGIVGEAGIGKSRLVAELIGRAQRAGFVGYAGAAQLTAMQAAYHAWQPIWRAFFRLDSLAPADEQRASLEREVAALDPELLARLPLLGILLDISLPELASTRAVEARHAKEALEDLLVRCLRARLMSTGSAASPTPLLLVLEDAQWLDTLSRDLLTMIGQAIAGLPVLLVVVYRVPEPPGAPPIAIERLPHGAEIRLDELESGDAARLAEQRAATAFDSQTRLPAQLIEAITQRAQGNPFFIEELINYLRDQEIMPGDTTALTHLELPGSLASLILSRIDQLTSTQQTTLKVASVVGRIFPVAWLWGGYPALGAVEQVQRDLEHLARLDITPLDTPEPELRYIFKHATTQNVVYESIPFALRAQLHDQLAAWLEAIPGSAASLDLLAFHYGRSTNTERQQIYFRAAGDAAAARYDNQAAVHYYERLLPLLAPADQAPVLLALGAALNNISAWDQAEAHYRTALELADRAGDERLRAQARLGIGDTLRSRWQPAEAATWLEAARRDFDAIGDDAGVTSATLILANAAWQRGELDQAQAILQEQLPLLTERDDIANLAQTMALLGNVASSRSDFQAAQVWWQRSLELRRMLGDKEGVAIMTDDLALAALLEGRFDEAQNLVSQAMDVFREIGARREYGLSRDILATVMQARGAPLEARALIMKNLELYRELGAQAEFAVSVVGLADTLLSDTTAPADYRGATTIIGMALRLDALAGSTMIPLHRARADALLETARAALSEAETAAAWAAGQAMDWLQAISYIERFRGT